MVKKNKVSRSVKKVITISVSLGTILILAAIWITALVATGDKGDSSSKATPQSVERTLTGKSDDDNRKEVLKVAESVLNDSLKSPKNEDFNARMVALDEGNFKVVSEDLKNNMRFKDIFEDTKTLQANTYQSLITMSTLMAKSSSVDKILPASDDVWTAVYVDSEAGVAFVPLSAFQGGNIGFSLEFIYDGDSWKLSPYSLIDSVKLSSNIQNSLNSEKAE